MEEHRSRVTAQLSALAQQPYAASGFPERQGGTARYGEAVAAFEMLGHSDLSLFVKAGVQWGLFGGAVSLLGTSRHDHLVPRLVSGELQGLLRDDRDRPRQRRPEPADDRHLRPGHRRDRRPLPRAGRAQGLHRQRGARRQPRSRVRPARRRRRVPRRALRARPDPRRRRRSRAGGHHRATAVAKLGLDGVDNGRLPLRPRPGPPHATSSAATATSTTTAPTRVPSRTPAAASSRCSARSSAGRISVAGGAGAAARSALAVTTTYAAGRRQFAAPGSRRGGHRPRLPHLPAAPAAEDRDGIRPPARPARARLAPWTTCSPGARRPSRTSAQLETRAAGIKVLTTRHATDTIQECRELVRRRGLPLGQPPRRAQGRHRHLHDVRGRQHGPAPARREVAPHASTRRPSATSTRRASCASAPGWSAAPSSSGRRRAASSSGSSTRRRGGRRTSPSASAAPSCGCCASARSTSSRAWPDGCGGRPRPAPTRSRSSTRRRTTSSMPRAAHVERLVAETFAASVESCADEDARPC